MQRRLTKTFSGQIDKAMERSVKPYNPWLCQSAAEVGVIALGKAQAILQGASPCRVRSNQPPVSSVDLIEELVN